MPLFSQAALTAGNGDRAKPGALKLTLPDGAGAFAFGWSGEAVIVEQGAHVVRRLLERRRIQQMKHGWLAQKEAVHEAADPGAFVIGAEGGKPHLPIEARLMRSDEGQVAMELAGLIGERVLAPMGEVFGAFEDDLRARGGHNSKEAVTVDDLERGQESERRSRRGREGWIDGLDELKKTEGDDHGKQHVGNRACERDAGDEPVVGLSEAEKTGKRSEGLIVEAPEAESDSEQVEEGVVACHDDADLKRDQERDGGLAEAAWAEEEEGHDEFDGEGEAGKEIEQPGGRPVGIIGERRGQRLGEEVEAEGVEVGPVGIVGGELDDARFEREAEQKKAKGPDEPGRAGEESEKTGFKQQRIPLEAGEGLADRDNGEVKDPAGGSGKAREEPRKQAEREKAAERAYPEEGRVAPIEPKDSGQVEEGFGPEGQAYVRERFGDGNDAVSAEQTYDLGPPGAESGQVDETQ